MDRRENIAAILALARRKLNEGQPSFALQAVVAALRAHGGEDAVVTALHQARTQYHGHVDNTPESDQLVALFAQCALAQPDAMLSSDASMYPDVIRPDIFSQEVNADDSMNPETQAAESRFGEQSSCDPVRAFGPQQLVDAAPSGIIARLEGGQTVEGKSEPGFGSQGHVDQESRVPILAESGRLQVVADASADGSSFTCPDCQGVVNSQRQKEHLELWCTRMH